MDDELKRQLHRLSQHVPEGRPDLGHVTRGGRRMKIKRNALATAISVVLIAASGVGMKAALELNERVPPTEVDVGEVPYRGPMFASRRNAIILAVWSKLQATGAPIADYFGFKKKRGGRLTLMFGHRRGEFKVDVTRSPLRIKALRGRIPPEVGAARLPGQALDIPVLQLERSNIVVDDVRVLPRSDGENGYDVTFDHFWIADLPAENGDLCEVSLETVDGEVLDSERFYLDPPTSDGARDGVTSTEFPGTGVTGVAEPRVTVECSRSETATGN